MEDISLQQQGGGQPSCEGAAAGNGHGDDDLLLADGFGFNGTYQPQEPDEGQQQAQQQQQQQQRQLEEEGIDLSGCIPSADLRPTDILCGRGNYDNPGNTTFIRVCEARKSEYLATTIFKDKRRIADEVLAELGRLGSRRFLQPVKGSNRKAARQQQTFVGGSGAGTGASSAPDAAYWKEMDQKAVAAKIKQALRQKRQPPKRRASASASGSAGGGGKTNGTGNDDGGGGGVAVVGDAGIDMSGLAGNDLFATSSGNVSGGVVGATPPSNSSSTYSVEQHLHQLRQERARLQRLQAQSQAQSQAKAQAQAQAQARDHVQGKGQYHRHHSQRHHHEQYLQEPQQHHHHQQQQHQQLHHHQHQQQQQQQHPYQEQQQLQQVQQQQQQQQQVQQQELQDYGGFCDAETELLKQLDIDLHEVEPNQQFGVGVGDSSGNLSALEPIPLPDEWQISSSRHNSLDLPPPPPPDHGEEPAAAVTAEDAAAVAAVAAAAIDTANALPTDMHHHHALYPTADANANANGMPATSDASHFDTGVASLPPSASAAATATTATATVFGNLNPLRTNSVTARATSDTSAYSGTSTSSRLSRSEVLATVRKALEYATTYGENQLISAASGTGTGGEDDAVTLAEVGRIIYGAVAAASGQRGGSSPEPQQLHRVSNQSPPLSSILSPSPPLSSSLAHQSPSLSPSFANQSPPPSDEGYSSASELRRSKKKTDATIACSYSTYHETLLELGYPLSFAFLVDCLMNPNALPADKFRSLDEVVEELQLMIRNPDRYLLDPPVELHGHQLRFPENKLYGRREHIASLFASFDQVIVSGAKSRGFVKVSGYSGCGKSALVDQIRPMLQKRRAMLINCKFDVRGRHAARSPLIFKAFDEYCKDLLTGDPMLLAEVQAAVRLALGPSAAVLKDLIPNLSGIVGDIAIASDDADEEAREIHRIVYHVRDFVRAIASPAHPIVMAFDDLQWANEQCLDVVSKLITDVSSRSVLFIGTYRDNELETADHPLEETLGEIATTNVPMSTIHLGNLDPLTVNDLVSDVLHLSPRLTRPLADVLHTKTRGNPLFVKQMIKVLHEDKLLYYSASRRRWEWDLEAIQEQLIADSAVELLVDMMKHYEADGQRMLQIASCFGSSFDAATVQLVYDSKDESAVFRHLDAAIKDGLIIQTGSKYSFSHDQIWQAAYSLTLPTEREEMHLRIGRQLLQGIPPAEIDSVVFTIVDQLNRGSALITDHDEKMTVARLNLKAGEKAKAAGSFLQASIYLKQATALVDEEDWEEQYNLCLRLYTVCAESQLAQADYEASIQAIEPVLAHGRNIRDKAPASYVCIVALIGQAKMHEALNMAMSVMEQLGEMFPVDPTEAEVKTAFNATKAFIQSASDSDVVTLPATKDATKVAVMRFALIATKCAYALSPQLFALVSFRMVKITLMSGLTPESSYAFAAFAIVCANLGAVRGGDVERYCARVAMTLSKKNDKYEHLVIVLLYHSVFPYHQPMQACLEQIKHAYVLGMRVGDTDWSLSILPRVSQVALFSGKQLNELEKEMRLNIQEIKSYKYKHWMIQVNLLVFQTVLNLTSSGEVSLDAQDPTILKGEAVDESVLLASFSDKPVRYVVRIYYYCRMFLAYLFRRYGIAAEIVDSHIELVKELQLLTNTASIYETFYWGLIALTAVRQGGEDAEKWNSIAIQSIDKMSEWAKLSEWNFLHKLRLLEAERSAFVDGDMESAAEAYASAISLAGKHNFVHEQAISCERCGLFHLERGNEAEGKQYLLRAIELYQTWGATRKAEDVSAYLREREFMGSW